MGIRPFKSTVTLQIHPRKDSSYVVDNKNESVGDLQGQIQAGALSLGVNALKPRKERNPLPVEVI